MRVIITGATGFVGRHLTEHLLREGHDLVLATRSVPKERSISSVKLHYSIWFPQNEEEILKEVDGADAIVNLAGEPIVGKRWTEEQKTKILESRVHVTRCLVKSIEKASSKPKVLINASAVGFYGSRGNDELTEASSGGDGYLSEVCRAWEAHAIRAEDFGLRVVRMRIGIVLEKWGGVLKLMVPPFQAFLGGWLGSGNQWMSWIHLTDLSRLISFSLENDKITGALNATTEQPVTNKAFSMVLAQTLKRPCFFPVPEIAVKTLLGEMSSLLLSSQKVLPKKATSLGFSFQYPDLRKALEAIFKK